MSSIDLNNDFVQETCDKLATGTIDITPSSLENLIEHLHRLELLQRHVSQLAVTVDGALGTWFDDID